METIHTAPYGANARKITQLVFSGFVATAAMVAVSYLLRLIGAPAPDFAAQYGAILNSQIHPDTFSGLWWAGLLWHFLNGTVIFSFLYDYLTHRMLLTSERRTKGIVYGTAIWLMVSLLVAPIAGEGIFFRLMPNPVVFAVAALMCWVAYGLVLDEMTRVPIVHDIGLSEKHAA